MTASAAEVRGRRAIRTAQVLLVLAALGLWGASRMPWVLIQTFDGLGQPKTTTLTGSTWSTALLPLALLALAAAVAALAVRGWPLRVLALLVAVASAAAGYLAVSQWVVPDVAVRAADLAGVQVMFLVGSERRYGGAIVTLVAAVCALAAAVLLMRGAAAGRATTTKYVAPAARRSIAREEGAADGAGRPSERMIWDALDEGRDPTTETPDSPESQPPSARPEGDAPDELSGEGR
ncbi:MAG TPA: TIGR02234 family membrane protein [Mycobacterium sp.]|nr:TIGR02234 family membrane protein [Mycobacterium sp.]